MILGEKRFGVTILGSGSKGNCTLIHYGQDAIMIDAGFSAKETRRRMMNAGVNGFHIRGILVTHEHDDHVKGLRVCSDMLEAPVYASMKCAQFLHGKDSHIPQMLTFAAGSTFPIGDFNICPFSIPHDAIEPVGFTVYCGNSKLSVVTDLGYVSSTVQYQIKDSDALVVESNHDLNMLAGSNRPWFLKQRIMGRQGHLSNEASRQLLECAITPRTKDVVLAHLSGECNTADLAEENAKNCLIQMQRQDIHLKVARQDAPLDTIWMT